MPTIFEWQPLTTSDAVLLLTTIILASAAFLAPFQAWRRRRDYMAPKLVPTFDPVEPMARLSSRSRNGRPTGLKVYDFHFKVVNSGRSPAVKTVAEVVEFWYDNGKGAMVKLETFMPVYLRYGPDTETTDVHPERIYYWNIAEIPEPSAQTGWKKKRAVFDPPGKRGRGPRVFLDLFKPPHNQVNSLLKGTYGLKVVLFSENAEPAEISLLISWKGKWRPATDQMLEDVDIRQVSAIPSTISA
jgi:hypothetical protein